MAKGSGGGGRSGRSGGGEGAPDNQQSGEVFREANALQAILNRLHAL